MFKEDLAPAGENKVRFDHDFYYQTSGYPQKRTKNFEEAKDFAQKQANNLRTNVKVRAVTKKTTYAGSIPERIEIDSTLLGWAEPEATGNCYICGAETFHEVPRGAEPVCIGKCK